MLAARTKPQVIGINSIFFLICYLMIFSVVFLSAKQQYQVRFVVPRDDVRSDELFAFSRKYILSYIGHLKQQRYRIHGDIVSQLQYDIDKMIALKDPATVLVIKFEPHDTYGDFVQIVNVALKNHIKRYGWVDDEFYFLPYEWVAED